jgi:hypothetical protein
MWFNLLKIFFFVLMNEFGLERFRSIVLENFELKIITKVFAD